MPNKKIIVTGGAGYIGSLLIPKLVKADYQVIIIDNFSYQNIGAIKQFVNHPQIKIVSESILNASKISRYFRGAQTVVHLAAIVGDQACEIDQKNAHKINVDGAITVSELAQKNNINHFIYSSSCSIYGASEYSIDEYSPFNPLSYYAQTKIEAEIGLAKLASKKFHVTAIRFATLFGLSPRMRFDLVVNLLTAKAIYENKITIFGGKQWRPFLHVDDATNAILQIASQAPKSILDTYNVGNNENNFTLDCIGDIIHNLVPSAVKKTNKNQPDQRNYRVDFSKFHRDFANTPKWSLEEGIQEMISVLESLKLDYKNSKYNNYEFLKGRI